MSTLARFVVLALPLALGFVSSGCADHARDGAPPPVTPAARGGSGASGGAAAPSGGGGSYGNEAGGGAGASGGNVDPATLCGHALDLIAAQLAASGATMPEDQRKHMLGQCTAEAEKERTTNPGNYACESSCVVAAKTADDLEVCKKKCP
jgi:hypothetical protein